jgi:hypothetical protein
MILWHLTVNEQLHAFLCQFNLLLLADRKCCIIWGQKSSFINITSYHPNKLHPFSTSMDNRLEFPGETDPLLHFKFPNH